jgi:hypothetical protein
MSDNPLSSHSQAPTPDPVYCDSKPGCGPSAETLNRVAQAPTEASKGVGQPEVKG